MDHEARIAYIMAQTVACQCELQAMIAANAERAARGHVQAYDEEAFRALPVQFGIDHNSVISYLAQ